MKNRLNIKKIAKERGMTLVEVARKMGIYRSNMSAIASGARGISLDMLKKMCLILDCSIDELVKEHKEPTVFVQNEVQNELEKIDKSSNNGADKTWVNLLMLATMNHYKRAIKA